MAHIPKIDEANLQAICDILGDTNTGLTGPEIGRYLRECGCPDPLQPKGVFGAYCNGTASFTANERR